MDEILSRLEGGKHIVLEFGQYTKPLQYMLVANILTREIHRKYVQNKERAQGGGSGESGRSS